MNEQAHAAMGLRASPAISDTGATGYAPSSLGTPSPEPEPEEVQVEDVEMEVIEPEPSPTQLAIRGILQTDPLGEVELTLLAEAVADMAADRGLPPNMSASLHEPGQVPRTCCFDAAGAPLSTWTYHKLCYRCKLLNRGLQG